MRNFWKFGLRFCRKAFMPSAASSEPHTCASSSMPCCHEAYSMSDSELSDFLVMRMVSALWPFMVSHHFSVSARRSFCGTHLLIRPTSAASFAPKRRAQKIISRARRSPMMRGMYCVAPTVGHAPTLAPVWPSTAFSEAMARSHQSANSWPPPMHQPLIMAITGIGKPRMVIASPSMRSFHM